jgi:hypothetical protein
MEDIFFGDAEGIAVAEEDQIADGLVERAFESFGDDFIVFEFGHEIAKFSGAEECGEMEVGGRCESGSRLRRLGGEIAKARGEGRLNGLHERGFKLRELSPQLLEVVTAANGLEEEVVVHVEGNQPSAGGIGEEALTGSRCGNDFSAETPLEEELSVEGIEGLCGRVMGSVEERRDEIAERGFDGFALRFGEFTGEFVSVEIASGRDG